MLVEAQMCLGVVRIQEGGFSCQISYLHKCRLVRLIVLKGIYLIITVR